MIRILSLPKSLLPSLPSVAEKEPPPTQQPRAAIEAETPPAPDPVSAPPALVEAPSAAPVEAPVEAPVATSFAAADAPADPTREAAASPEASESTKNADKDKEKDTPENPEPKLTTFPQAEEAAFIPTPEATQNAVKVSEERAEGEENVVEVEVTGNHCTPSAPNQEVKGAEGAEGAEIASKDATAVESGGIILVDTAPSTPCTPSTQWMTRDEAMKRYKLKDLKEMASEKGIDVEGKRKVDLATALFG